jgi:hypothetical protein
MHNVQQINICENEIKNKKKPQVSEVSACGLSASSAAVLMLILI